MYDLVVCVVFIIEKFKELGKHFFVLLESVYFSPYQVGTEVPEVLQKLLELFEKQDESEGVVGEIEAVEYFLPARDFLQADSGLGQ